VRDFWLSCGHHLLDREPGGGLVVTDAFLKAYVARPELMPPADACAVERGLHQRLLAQPRVGIAADEIATIADPDARENWDLMIAFRDHLLAHPTLEAAYCALVRRGPGRTPPLFLNQLVHVILRNALDGCDDPFVLRAAELLFRPQRVTRHEGALLAADQERIAGDDPAQVSPLVAMLGLAATIDVLGDDNCATYWDRSDSFDMALDLTAGRRGLEALAIVLERWIGHLHGVAVEIAPLVEVRDAALTWYVGLDAEASRIGDRLWNGENLDDATRERVIALFRAQFRGSRHVDDKAASEPVYLLLAMTADKVLHMKPQNLVTGLPIRRLEVVT
jgi:hypothetical protein